MKYKKRDDGSFVINIKYRQHASWQGTILWADQKKTANFRSALEMLQLISGALDGDIADEPVSPEEEGVWMDKA